MTFAQLQFAICCLSRTFDQRMFDFHGNCEYVLARGKMSRTDTFAVIVRWAARDDHFEQLLVQLSAVRSCSPIIITIIVMLIILQLSPSSVPCGTSGVTCSKAVTVKVGTGPHQERIKMRKGREVERMA